MELGEDGVGDDDKKLDGIDPTFPRCGDKEGGGNRCTGRGDLEECSRKVNDGGSI